MTTSGTVIATIAAGVATDAAGNANLASTSSDNTVTYDVTAPSVTINQASTQSDPTNTSPINFTVVFSEAVTGFNSADVTLSGTAGATTVVVTGSGTTYNVAVSGMTTSGTVIATIGAGVAFDLAGNSNAASTSTDNTVTFITNAPTVTGFQTNGGLAQRSILTEFKVFFSENVNFDASSFVLKKNGVVMSAAQVGISVAGSGTNTATITFTGGTEVIPLAWSLTDGNWELVVLANAVTSVANGSALAAGASHSDYRFFGDLDGDRDVDGMDYFASRNAANLPYLDLNDNGLLDSAEFAALLANLGKRLTP
jgi:hypothetical protein